MYQKSSSKTECGCACGSSKIKSVFSGEEVRPIGSRLVKHFQENWKKLTNYPKILELMEGYQIPFSSGPKQTKPPNPACLTKRLESLVDLEFQATFKKSQNQFLSPTFLVEKKDLGYRPAINLKKLNQNIPYIHFKMKGLFLIQVLLKKGDFLCTLDLKDADFSVTLHKICRNYLRLLWRENLYEFLCLCFGLGPAPRIFTKIMKIPIV